MMHQNFPVDASQVSGFSSSPKNQVAEKHLVQQSQGFFPGTLSLSSTLPQTGNQQKMYSRVLPQSSKQMTVKARFNNSIKSSSSQSPVQAFIMQTPMCSHIYKSACLTPAQHETARTSSSISGAHCFLYVTTCMSKAAHFPFKFAPNQRPCIFFLKRSTEPKFGPCLHQLGP